MYLLGRDVFSAKISYGVSDEIRLFVAGNNLLSEDLTEVSGPPELKSIRRRYNFGRGSSNRSRTFQA